MDSSVLFTVLFLLSGNVLLRRTADGVPLGALDCAQLLKLTKGSNVTVNCDPKTGKPSALQTNEKGERFCVGPDGKILSKPSKELSACDCVLKSATLKFKANTTEAAPQCDMKTGDYLPQQCDKMGACRCVDFAGHQLGLRWNSKNVTVDLSRTNQPDRPSCETMREIFGHSSTKKA